MRLSVRLIALGVSGPIVGLGMFLAVSMATSIQLAKTAKTELTSLFNQDNRTNLLITTSMIQSNTDDITKQLVSNSEQLQKVLQPLRYQGNNRLTWKGQPLALSQAPKTLNNLLRLPSKAAGSQQKRLLLNSKISISIKKIMPSSRATPWYCATVIGG
jgi:hypothetical protein